MPDPFQIRLRATLIAAAFSVTAGAAAALSQSELEAYDVDDDGFIEKGAEVRALERDFTLLNGQQQSRLGRFLDEDAEKLPLSELGFASLYEELAASCRSGKRFYLAETLSGVLLVHPDIVVMSDKGARFSLSHDNRSGETAWSVQGVAVYAPKSINRCLHADSPEQLRGGELTGYAIAPYLAFSGSGSSSAKGPSDLRVGAVVDLQFFGGGFDLQQVQISPFFRTDFQGEAEIYGANLRWTPYKFTGRLNGLQGDAGHSGVDFQLSADIEYLSVVRAGNSGLVSGTDYGWIGLQAGIGYEPPALKGTRLSVGVDAAYDVINDRDAVLYQAGVTIPIGEGSNAALDLRYRNGTNRDDPAKIDGFTADFRIKF